MTGDSPVIVRLLGPADAALLDAAGTDVFDRPPQPALVREFLDDPRHHVAAAIAGGRIVGFASAVHYVHPDKPAQLFVNEVGVADSHRRRGLAGRLLGVLLEHGRALGCREAWVATEPDNQAARALYGSAGGREHAERFVMFTFPLDEPS
jgi:ribosomal protein S18 acetylase RimI-like enzyme